MSRVSSPSGLHNEAATLAERVVSIASGGSATLTKEDHANRLILVAGGASATALKMPHASGSGDVYEFLVTAPQTSGSITVTLQHGVSSNAFLGTVWQHGSANVMTTFSASSSLEADVITLNGTTTGAQRAGDYIKLVDSAVGTWSVADMRSHVSGDAATPFSAP